MLNTKVDSLTQETLGGLRKLETQLSEREQGLRGELNKMADRLERGHGELQAAIDRTAAAGRSSNATRSHPTPQKMSFRAFRTCHCASLSLKVLLRGMSYQSGARR